MRGTTQNIARSARGSTPSAEAIQLGPQPSTAPFAPQCVGICAGKLGITMRCTTTLATHRATSAIHTRDDTPVA